MDIAAADPKGLIRESFRIDGIRPEECRAIFLDWALSLPEGITPDAAIPSLLARYGEGDPGHPMNAVLREGQSAAATPIRRGGRAARVPPGG